jgi:hypothetical protein
MMTARRVEEATDRLRVLKQDEWSGLALGGLAMAMALAASALHPPLALPLLIGAFAVTGFALRALFLRCELFDKLLLDRDAYAIPEVRRRAVKAASMESRRELARLVRNLLNPATAYPLRRRVAAVSDDLADLARELADETLTLEPWCAVRCEQLLTSVPDSPLLNEALPPEDLLARINQIRAGFRRPLGG